MDRSVEVGTGQLQELQHQQWNSCATCSELVNPFDLTVRLLPPNGGQVRLWCGCMCLGIVGEGLGPCGVALGVARIVHCRDDEIATDAGAYGHHDAGCGRKQGGLQIECEDERTTGGD